MSQNADLTTKSLQQPPEFRGWPWIASFPHNSRPNWISMPKQGDNDRAIGVVKESIAKFAKASPAGEPEDHFLRKHLNEVHADGAVMEASRPTAAIAIFITGYEIV